MGLLTVKAAAERLHVAVATVYHLCSALKLRHLRVGTGRGTIRIPETSLEEFMRQATVEPRPGT